MVFTLKWKFNIPTKTLHLHISENLKYEAENGGVEYIKKITDDSVDLLNQKQWEEEKKWLSSTFSNLGTYKFTPDVEQSTDIPCWPVFGRDETTCRDRLGRSSHTMDHSLVTDIITVGDKRYVTFNQGRTILKVKTDPITGLLFNCMPCDVFPYNPGYEIVELQEVRPYVEDSIYERLVKYTYGTDTSEKFFEYYIL